MDLFVITAFSLLVTPLVIFTAGITRVVLALAVVLFFPGYTMVAALYPRRSDLNEIERVALGFGLSVAVVPLIGLANNYMPWGIHLYPLLVSVELFILTMSSLAWWRRKRVRQGERFEPKLRPNISLLSNLWIPQRRWGRILAVALVVSMAGAIGIFGYVLVTPKQGERFTEFYALGADGKLGGYPEEGVAGQPVVFRLAIVNRERETTEYYVRIDLDGQDVGEIGPLVLASYEKWDKDIAFTPTRAGADQKVQLQLIRVGYQQVYRTLQFWITVKEG